MSCGCDAEARRRIAVDRDRELQPGILLVAGDVGKGGQLAIAPPRRSGAHDASSSAVNVGQRVLVLRLGDAPADGDVLGRLHDRGECR